MISWKKVLIAAIVISCIGAGLTFWYKRADYSIREAEFQRDFVNIDALFHKGDNWYWMICNEHMDSYSIEKLLRYKTSDQYATVPPRNDLIIKVMEIDGKIAGLTAYYPKSPYIWQLLFLIVDQDFRQRGVAKKLLMYATKDIAAHGAIKVDMVTRIENERAIKLYNQFGFKQIGSTKQHVMFVWYPSWGFPSWA